MSGSFPCSMPEGSSGVRRPPAVECREGLGCSGCCECGGHNHGKLTEEGLIPGAVSRPVCMVTAFTSVTFESPKGLGVWERIKL